MRSLLALAIAAVGTSMLPSTGAAAPVCSTLTGNCYDYINFARPGEPAQSSWSWLEAFADAQLRTFVDSDGVQRQGHLVTITSPEEEQILIQNWLGDILYGQPIIGLYRLPGSNQDTGWQWVTGEAFGYENWYTGEPNDAGAPPAGDRELYVHYRSEGVASVTNFVGYGWNDMLEERRGYFIEYARVPAPATAMLLALGGLGLLGAMRARRRG